MLMTTFSFAMLAFVVIASYVLGRGRALAIMSEQSGGVGQLHSRPTYHGSFLALTAGLLMFAVLLAGGQIVTRLATSAALSPFGAEAAADNLQRGAILRDVINVAQGQFSGTLSTDLKRAADDYVATRTLGAWAVLIFGLALASLAAAWGYRQITPAFRARNTVERIVTILLAASAGIAVLTTIGIVFSVVFETYRFFFDTRLSGRPTIPEFLFGTQWSPQTAMRADQGQTGGAFGLIPLLTGTMLITFIAITVAGPVGLFAAIYMSEYAGPRTRSVVKPILEILAGIPTVVLGFFAALTLAPLIRAAGESMGLSVASESALAAGLIMGMMIIPFVSSLSDDVINAVPQSLRDGSYAMGATKSETIKKVILPAALPGIVSAFMLAISRAVGETMIVVMAAGLAANLTLNPLEAVTTITVQIKTILVGDQEFDSAKTLAAFALGFVLFFFTLALNVVALRVVQKYREQYD